MKIKSYIMKLLKPITRTLLIRVYHSIEKLRLKHTSFKLLQYWADDENNQLIISQLEKMD